MFGLSHFVCACACMHIHVHFFFFKGAYVRVIIVGNGDSNPSSNPRWDDLDFTLCYLLPLGKVWVQLWVNSWLDSSLALVRQLIRKKENSDSKPAVICLKKRPCHILPVVEELVNTYLKKTWVLTMSNTN